MNRMAFALLIVFAAATSLAQTNLTGRAKFLQRTGGFVTREIQKGERVVSLIDETERGESELAAFRNTLTDLMGVPVVIGQDDTNAVVRLYLTESGPFAVDVVDRSAKVPIGTDAKSTQMNLGRAFLAICATDASLMTQEGMLIVARTMSGQGMQPFRRTTYRNAVREGWAPAPTNDAQRAIWDAVKAQTATNAPAATPPAK